MKKTIDPAHAAALTEIVRAIEGSSSAEVVVEVRARSGSYVQADHQTGFAVAFTALLFVLFSPWDFAPIWVPVVVLAAYAAGLLVSSRTDALRRLLTPRSQREQNVRTFAAAAFVERGVANTVRETGLLVYLSLLERRIELLADRGVLDAAPVLEWNQFIESVRDSRATPAALVDVMRTLQPMLTRYLPARGSDRNEVSDKVRLANE